MTGAENKSGNSPGLEVTFWGVRGSVPSPRPDNMGHGGNTSCVQVRRPGSAPLVFDTGTGIRALGQNLNEPAVHIFYSHLHWDHIQGLPFFRPLYHPGCRVTFCAGIPARKLEAALRAQMSSPYFPVSFPEPGGAGRFRQATAEGVEAGGVRVVPFPLRHPSGCTGYRIEAPDAVVVFITDHEHGDPAIDAGVARHCCEADLLIYDAQYLPAEYPARQGWGHSTWEQAVRLASEAGVKRLALFHHDPDRSDEELARVESAARAVFEPTVAAREGLRIRAGGAGKESR